MNSKMSPVIAGPLKMQRTIVFKKSIFNPSKASTINSSPTHSGLSDVRVKNINFVGSRVSSKCSNTRAQKIDFNFRTKTLDLT